MRRSRQWRASLRFRNTSWAPSSRQYHATLRSRSRTLSSTCAMPVIGGAASATARLVRDGDCARAQLRETHPEIRGVHLEQRLWIGEAGEGVLAEAAEADAVGLTRGEERL